MHKGKIGFKVVKLALVFFFLASIGSTLQGRAIPQTQVTQITFWYTENDTEKPGILSLIAQFQAANPDITVEALQKGFFDAKSLYVNAFISGNEPNVFRAARDWVTEFAAAEMLAPLTAEYTAEDIADFIPIAVEMVSYPDSDGVNQIWAFPQVVDTPSLMYNKHIFEAAGINTTKLTLNTSWTWDEYYGNCTLINQTTGLYATTLAGMFFGAQPIFYGHGAEMFSNGTVDISHIAINSAASRTALTFLKNVTDAAFTPPWEEQGWTPLNVLFATDGTAAMISQGPWELKNFLDNSPEFNANVVGAKDYAGPENLGIIQQPHDAEGHTGAPIGGQNYVISRFTTGSSYDAAIKLAKFLSGEEAMAQAAIDYYHVPGRQSVMNRTDVKNSPSYPYVQGFYQAALNAPKNPVASDWAVLETHFANKIDEYLADDITLDECIEQTIALWRQTLGQETSGTTSGYTETAGKISSFPVSALSIFFISAILGFAIKILRKRKV